MRTDYKPFSLEPSTRFPQDNHSTNAHGEFSPENHHKTSGILHQIWQFFEKYFIKFLPFPPFREYPPRFMFCAGGILLSMMFLLFGVLFGYLYATNLSTIFLSPVEKKDSNAYCQQILSTNTGHYLGTAGGLWEGSKGFVYANATYVLYTSNLQISQHDYSGLMNELYSVLQEVGEITSRQDLGFNLLFWFSFIGVPDTSTPSNRFMFVGDPSIALNKPNIFGTISSVHGECKLDDLYASFDHANGQLILHVPHDAYMSDPICSSAGDLAYLGYDQFATANTFQLKVDVYSLITALAVNLKMTRINYLVEIEALRTVVPFQGQMQVISQHFNPKFPGMTPIVCINLMLCGMRLGPSNLAVPFFHHVGSSLVFPEKCNCSLLTLEELSDPRSPCNLFRFLTGFLYFPTIDFTVLGTFIGRGTFEQLHDALYPPSFVASAFGINSPLYPQMNSASSRDKLYQFCSLSIGMNCSLVTFTVFDSTFPDWSISPYYYQLSTGACQNRFAIPYSTWKKLIDTPFTSLTQDYTQCTYSPTFVFFTQLGSALGTMGLIIRISILMTLIILFIYQRVTGDMIPVTYTKDEREAALKALAVSLLLTRDHQKKIVSGQNPDGDDDDSSVEGNHINEDRNNHNNPSRKEELNREDTILVKLIHELHVDSEFHSDAHKLKNIVSDLRKEENTKKSGRNDNRYKKDSPLIKREPGYDMIELGGSRKVVPEK